ncbi:hypothetical protein ACC704_37735, partial [Rhizobium johnstonii]|uniref:hypothetical protein n=1 Tax=Rhizobium johnstonii TaxID=3019933 RepID=UPI003F9931D0
LTLVHATESIDAIIVDLNLRYEDGMLDKVITQHCADVWIVINDQHVLQDMLHSGFACQT